MAAPKASRRNTVGKAFRLTDEKKPVGLAFHQTTEEKLPPVLLMDRPTLKLLRTLAEERGWPRRMKFGSALGVAQRLGLLSLTPMIARYGAVELSKAHFMVLPVLDGREVEDLPKTFRAREHNGVVVLFPPGWDPSIPPPDEKHPPITLHCVFFPFAGRQEEAVAAAEFEVLTGGAKGGAKTETIVAMAARQIDRPAYKGLIFRKTEKALEEVEARAKSMFEPIGGSYSVDERIFTFPSGAKIELGYAEVEAHTDRYQGREFAFVGGDEVAQVADRKVRTRLISECRCKDPDVVNMVRWTANPIGPGVADLKRLFIGPCGADGKRIHVDVYDIEGIGKVERTRRFIPSKVTDNPVYRNDPVYMATLHSLPDRMKRLLLHGDWSAAMGVALDELSWAKHWVSVEDKRHPGQIPLNWKLYGFFDWGFAHRWAFVIITVDEAGHAWGVDTLWGHRQYAEDIAARVHEWANEDGHRMPKPVYGSRQCFQRYQAQVQGVPTFAEQFAQLKIPMFQANESQGSRVTGVNNLRQWLAWQKSGADGKEGDPKLKFLETHGNRILFTQLEEMVPDPDDPEDVLKVDYDEDAEEDGINASGDDGYDALKMFALIRPMAAKMVLEKPKTSKHYDSYGDKVLAMRARAMNPGGRGF